MTTHEKRQQRVEASRERWNKRGALMTFAEIESRGALGSFPATMRRFGDFNIAPE